MRVLNFHGGSGLIKYGYGLAKKLFAGEYSKTFPFGFYMSYKGLSLTLDKGNLTKNSDLNLKFAK